MAPSAQCHSPIGVAQRCHSCRSALSHGSLLALSCPLVFLSAVMHTEQAWSSASPAPCQPALSSHPISLQVNNATARVMTNKKTANPYTNGRDQCKERLSGHGHG